MEIIPNQLYTDGELGVYLRFSDDEQKAANAIRSRRARDASSIPPWVKIGPRIVRTMGKDILDFIEMNRVLEI